MLRGIITILAFFSIPRRIRNKKGACIAEARPGVDAECGDAMVLPPSSRTEDPSSASGTRTEKKDAAKDKTDDQWRVMANFKAIFRIGGRQPGRESGGARNRVGS